MGNLVRWVRALGFEGHQDQLDAVLRVAPHTPSSGVVAPNIVWRRSERMGDVTLLRAQSIAQWDATARNMAASSSGAAAPVPKSVFERPYALIGHSPKHMHLDQCVDSNSPKHVALMWLAFAGQSETALVEFTLGRQLMELLTSVGVQNKADSVFHLTDSVGLLATAQLGSQSVSLTPTATPERLWDARWTRRPSAALPPPHFGASAMSRILGHYCRTTTSRLFKTRLQAAEFFANPGSAVLLDDLDEQTLAILVVLRQGVHRFDELADSTGMEDTRLGNMLIGLKLCGLVSIQSDAAVASLLMQPEPQTPRRGLKLLGTLGLIPSPDGHSTLDSASNSLVKSSFAQSVAAWTSSFSAKSSKNKGNH